MSLASSGGSAIIRDPGGAAIDVDGARDVIACGTFGNRLRFLLRAVR